jgi:hypothetical protein
VPSDSVSFGNLPARVTYLNVLPIQPCLVTVTVITVRAGSFLPRKRTASLSFVPLSVEDTLRNLQPLPLQLIVTFEPAGALDTVSVCTWVRLP